MDHVLWYPGQERILDNVVGVDDGRLRTADGKAYVDLESGVWCTPLGSGHPRVVDALTRQLRRIAHTGFNYTCEVVEVAARELLEVAGLGGGRCTFLCSGSEAVEYGVRAARSVSERPRFLTMADSYFGAYGAASVRDDASWHALDWTACDDCPGDGGCGEDCPLWSSIPFGQIGAFLFEPGSSAGLVRFPPERLVQAIARRVRDDGGVVLVNEVTTGVGRTGPWFGFEHYDLAPDFVAVGKGIGNGYPVSAALFGPEMIARMGGRPIAYAQSHQNDPLGAAVVRAVIAAIEDGGLLARGRTLSERLLGGLERIRSRRRRVETVRGRGLMAAADLVDGPDREFAVRVHRGLAERGFLVGLRAGLSVLRLDPNLTIADDDLDRFLVALDETLSDD